MNTRIKKKKAKQARQREQEIRTVIGHFVENIAEALRSWEEELDKENSN